MRPISTPTITSPEFYRIRTDFVDFAFNFFRDGVSDDVSDRTFKLRFFSGGIMVLQKDPATNGSGRVTFALTTVDKSLIKDSAQVILVEIKAGPTEKTLVMGELFWGVKEKRNVGLEDPAEISINYKTATKELLISLGIVDHGSSSAANSAAIAGEHAQVALAVKNDVNQKFNAIETTHVQIIQNLSSSHNILQENQTILAQTTALKVAAENAVANAALGQNPLGEYNATTNTPPLSQTPPTQEPNGSYYDITIEGEAAFAGSNFNIGQIFRVGGRVIKKNNVSWYYRPPSDLALVRVTELENKLDGEVEAENTNLLTGSKVYDWFALGDIREVPLGYKDGTYNTYLSRGYSFHDRRAIVTDKSLFKSINVVVARTPGTINILAIAMNGTVLHSETKNTTIGINELRFSSLSSINEAFYVGIQLILGQAEVRTTSPPNGEGFSFIRADGSGTWNPSNYRYAYSINLGEGGLDGRIKRLEILTKSDTTNLKNALSRSSKVTLDAKSFVIDEPLIVPSGSTLSGVFGRSILEKGEGFIGDMLIIDGKEDVEINNIRLKGNLQSYAYSMNGINSGPEIIETEQNALDGLYMGNNNGLKVKNSERILLSGLQFHNLDGIGLIVDRVGRSYIHGLKASQLWFYNCYKGILTTNEHEFSHYSDVMVSLCQIGIHCDSGNIQFNSPIITRCRIGAMFTGAGINHAHGIMSNAEIKHNQIAGLFVHDVMYGQYFPGMYLSYCSLVVRNSQKLYFPSLMVGNGMKLDCTDSTGSLAANLIASHFSTHSAGMTILNMGNFNIPP